MSRTSNQFTRQLDLMDMKSLQSKAVTLIGVGAIGSFVALTLTKMGVNKLTVYDNDGVSEHNLPNQFYRQDDVDAFKVDALQQILENFNSVRIRMKNKFFSNQKLEETVIVATDTMASRTKVWSQFIRQPQCRNLIEARMGAEVGMVYTIRKRKFNNAISPKDFNFYEDRLYPDSKVKPLPCTARSIIYNVLMIASLVSRAYKAIIMHEIHPREVIFNMTFVNDRSLLIRE